MANRARGGVAASIVAVVVGAAIVGVMVFRSVSVLSIDDNGALSTFEEARTRVASATPLMERDASGALVRRRSATPAGPVPTELHALAYHVAGHRLVRADVPFWFLRVKGPVLRYAVRDTSLDLDALNLTAGDLEEAGASVVLDETRSNGDRLLVWTD